MNHRPGFRFYATAFGGVLALFLLVWLYVREFAVFYNTIGVRRLIIGSFIVGALVAAALLYAWRRRLTPWTNHLPEVFTIIIFTVLFAPLFSSLLNRAGAREVHQSFDFLSETPFLSSQYGLLKGEKLKPSGYFLEVREGDRLRRFKYSEQAYYPLTKPGEKIALPIKRGWLGFRVMQLR